MTLAAIGSLLVLLVGMLIVGRRSIWAGIAGLLCGSAVWIYNFGSLLH